MVLQPLVHRLTAGALHFRGFGLGLAPGQYQTDRAGTEGFLGVAAKAAEVFSLRGSATDSLQFGRYYVGV